MLAERFSLFPTSPCSSSSGSSSQTPLRRLHHVLAMHITSHQEGLVLKATESAYNDNRCPWVKMKMDYIPGYGDCVDLVVLAAGRDKERARELRGEWVLSF